MLLSDVEAYMCVQHLQGKVPTDFCATDSAAAAAALALPIPSGSIWPAYHTTNTVCRVVMAVLQPVPTSAAGVYTRNPSCWRDSLSC